MKAQAHSPCLFSPFTPSHTLFSPLVPVGETRVRPFLSVPHSFSSFFLVVSFYLSTLDFHSRPPRERSGLSGLCVKSDWISLQVSLGLGPAFPA